MCVASECRTSQELNEVPFGKENARLRAIWRNKTEESDTIMSTMHMGLIDEMVPARRLAKSWMCCVCLYWCLVVLAAKSARALSAWAKGRAQQSKRNRMQSDTQAASSGSSTRVACARLRSPVPHDRKPPEMSSRSDHLYVMICSSKRFLQDGQAERISLSLSLSRASIRVLSGLGACEVASARSRGHHGLNLGGCWRPKSDFLESGWIGVSNARMPSFHTRELTSDRGPDEEAQVVLLFSPL